MDGALPVLSLEGAGFAISGSARQTAPNGHERGFGLFGAATPGVGGYVRASVGTQSYAAAGSFVMGEPLAAVLEAKTRTALLYADRNSLRVAYQLRDAVGESRVSQSGLSVALRLRFDDGAQDHVASCSLPTQESGIGECASTIASSSFGPAARTASVEVSAQYSGSGTAFVASGGSVTLQAVVAQ